MKKEKLVMVYSDENYSLEDYFKNEIDNGNIPENTTFEEWVKNNNNINRFYDDISDYLQEDFDNIRYECNNILKNFDFVQFEAVQNRWNGQACLSKIVYMSDIDDIFKKIKFDRADIKLYENKITIKNCHHDGTNYCDLLFKNWRDYRKKDIIELIRERIDDKQIKDFINSYYDKKFYQFNKSELIEFFKEFCQDEI